MKINCESCGKPITSQVNSRFEQFEPGRVVCPHCGHKQKRYISEADLLIYFCFSAVLYSIVLVFIFFLLNWKMQVWILILAVGLFVATYFAMKYGSAMLYEKAYFKADIKIKSFRRTSTPCANASKRNSFCLCWWRSCSVLSRNSSPSYSS